MAAESRPLFRPALLLGGLIVFGTCVAVSIGSVFRMPRVLGDELIYWDSARSLAFTGHLAVRGEHSTSYGLLYPALLAPLQRLASTPANAYALARVFGSVAFASSVVPMYFLAKRLLSGTRLVTVCLLTIFVPSLVYTSAILTENLFYPVFLVAILAMVRALERPSLGRQLALLGIVAIACSVRIQAIMIVPAYLLAGSVLALRGPNGERLRGRQGLDALGRWLRTPLASIAAALLAIGLVQASRGRWPLSLLGAYSTLVRLYNPLEVAKWFVFSLADLDLYLGVVPLAALIILASRLWHPGDLLSDAVAVQVAVTVAVVLSITIAVAGFSSTHIALGRVHERNFFYVAPLVLLCFFVWMDTGLPRPRVVAICAALAVSVLPAVLSRLVVKNAGTDAMALIPWQVVGLSQAAQSAVLLFYCAALSVLFLRIRPRYAAALPMVVAAVFVTLLLVGEASALRRQRNVEHSGFTPSSASWVDAAVGAGARVSLLWNGEFQLASTSGRTDRGQLMHDYWNLEFFNRSVQSVAAVGTPLPDGLPFVQLQVMEDGCISTSSTALRPSYVVAERSLRIAAKAVASSPNGEFRLYRSLAGPRCWLRLSGPLR